MQLFRTRRLALLLTCLSGPLPLLWTASVRGADNPAAHKVSGAGRAVSGGTAAAGRPVSARRKSPSSVTGGQEAVQVTALRRTVSHNAETVVGARELSQQVPGQNILKAVGQLPGVSYSSTDPLGIDSWGTSVYMRGFFQTQLAMTLDGVPLNNQAYTSTNGLNIANAWISDDISRVAVSQGGGALGVPSNTNLGGSMQFFTTDPKEKAGATVSQGFGSYAMKRTYVRIDSGDLNSTGTRFYVAYSRDFEKKYDASTPAFMQQVNTKFVQPVGQESRISAFFNWNEAEVYGYSDKTLGSLATYGWRQEWLAPNYPLAFQYAAGNYPAGWNNLYSGNYTQIYDGGQSTQDFIGGINFDMKLSDHLRWRTVLYAHRDISNATYNAPGTCSPGTSAEGTCATDGSDNGNYVDGQVPLSEQVWKNRQMREGFTSELEYRIQRHTISTGIWFEHNNYSLGTYYYNEPQLGQGKPLSTTGPYDTYGPAFATGWFYSYHTNTFQYHLQDSWRILDNLTATYGFKSLMQQTGGGNRVWDDTGNYSSINSRGPYGSVTAGEGFLPAVNIDWRFLPGHELYFDFAENMRPFIGNSYANSTDPSIYGVQSQDLFEQLKKHVPPERTFDYVLGYRYTSNFFTAGIDGYHTDDHNRLLLGSSGAIGGASQEATLVNAHRASEWGMDAIATIVPVKGLSITNSVSYNHFAYDSNVDMCWSGAAAPDGTSIADGCGSLKGKKLDGYPSVMYKANATYTYHHASVWLDVNYYSKRPYSIMNDTHVPAYWLANLGSSYDFGKVGPLKGVKISFMVYNLFNSKYISMMGENGFPVMGDYQSLERGPVREFFGTIKASY